MGKFFYGVDAVKEVAMRKADVAADSYRRGVCYTPSFRVPNSCKFDETTKLWTCYAPAHHHWGSCGSSEFTCSHRGTGELPYAIPIPHPFPEDFVNKPTGVVEDQIKPKSLDGKSNDITFETYEDALPEDYVTE